MRNSTISLVLVALLALVALYLVLPIGHPDWVTRVFSWGSEKPRDLKDFKLGLDLQGGTQILLEADVPTTQTLDAGAMTAARSIVENRVNGLGVSEANVQGQGANRLIVELPGVDNPDQAVETLR